MAPSPKTKPSSPIMSRHNPYTQPQAQSPQIQPLSQSPAQIQQSNQHRSSSKSSHSTRSSPTQTLRSSFMKKSPLPHSSSAPINSPQTPSIPKPKLDARRPPTLKETAQKDSASSNLPVTEAHGTAFGVLRGQCHVPGCACKSYQEEEKLVTGLLAMLKM